MNSEEHIESKYLFHPEHFFKVIFDLIGFLLIIYQSFTVPFNITYNFVEPSLKYFDYFSDIFFIIDILITFNSGIYKKGVLVMHRKTIIKTYLNGWFGFDLISSFPYSFLFDNLEETLTLSATAKNAPRLLKVIRLIKFVKILRLLKMVKLKSIFNKFEEVLSSYRIGGIYTYFKTMVIFYIIWHFMACFWFALVYQEYTEERDIMMPNDDLSGNDISYQYTFMLYFIFTSFFTVGYGDIHPRTKNEKLFSVFGLLLFYALFCYMMSKIRNNVQRSLESNQDLKFKLRSTKKFFREKKLPEDLTNKVSKYLEFMYTEKKERRMDDGDIFSLLNDKLGKELRIEMNKKILQNLKILKKSEYENVVNYMCDKVYEEIISPNEVIITEGDIISKRMYYIQQGHMLLYHDATTVVYKELGPNDHFGEVGFFSLAPNKVPRTASAITKTFTGISFILQHEFIQQLEEFHNTSVIGELFTLFENKDRKKVMEELEIKCIYCSEFHYIKDCTKFVKNATLLFISKQREKDYLERIKASSSLSDFQTFNLYHFHRLKSTLNRKIENGRRRGINSSLNFADDL